MILSLYFDIIQYYFMCHKIAVSLAGSKASSPSSDAPQSQPEKKAKQEGAQAKPGHSGYGANKNFPYIDE